MITTFRFAWLLAALTVASDQLTKVAVQSSLSPGQSLLLLPPLVHLTYVQNTGTAFGLFRGHVSVFALLSVVVAAWIIAELARRSHPRLAELGLALVLGGAIGNLLDRLRLGYVVDFIDLRVWPVFNLADSAITIGVVLLIVHQLMSFASRNS